MARLQPYDVTTVHYDVTSEIAVTQRGICLLFFYFLFFFFFSWRCILSGNRASMYCKLWRTEQRQIVCKIKNTSPPREGPLPAAD